MEPCELMPIITRWETIRDELAELGLLYSCSSGAMQYSCITIYKDEADMGKDPHLHDHESPWRFQNLEKLSQWLYGYHAGVGSPENEEKPDEA